MKYLLIVGFLISLGACTPKQEKNVNDMSHDVSVMTDEMKQDARRQWQETKSEAQELKVEIANRIDEIEISMKNATGEAKAEAAERKQELINWKNRLDAQMEKMGDDIEDSWESVVSETNEFFSEVRRSLDS